MRSAVNETAPPPFAPAAQHVGAPAPPVPKSDGCRMEPYVAFGEVPLPIPPYEPEASRGPRPEDIPRASLFCVTPSSLRAQPPRNPLPVTSKEESPST